ncbi:unnamed protein product [Lampetra fluviatilis]
MGARRLGLSLSRVEFGFTQSALRRSVRSVDNPHAPHRTPHTAHSTRRGESQRQRRWFCEETAVGGGGETDMADIKNHLYAWCGKRKLTPTYDIRCGNSKHRPTFTCEVRVEGYTYTGMGNSTAKKDAQSNAARDFVNYLVRVGEMKPEEVPALSTEGPSSLPGEGILPTGGPLPPHLALGGGQGGGTRPPSGGGGGGGAGGDGGYQSDRGLNLKEYYMKKEQEENEATLESEEVDLNAGLHGNWTLENAKSRLHQYFQKERIQADYTYSQVGPDHNRSFIAEMQLFIKKLGRKIFAREHGSNKKLAAQSCALSLVRQLYHLGVLEPFSGHTKKKEIEALEPFEVVVPPEVEEQLHGVVHDMGLQPVPPAANPGEAVSLTVNKLAHFEPSARQSFAGVVPWSPPQMNWNPWTSGNIDEGPLATATPEMVSRDLHSALVYKMENDDSYKQLASERLQLPMAEFREQLLAAVREHSVVIVRGQTGCGKTTQVPQFILDQFILDGHGADCSIVVTQPRRISAVSVAERVAFERGEDVGLSCGYSVRFESILPRPHGSILFCTVGVLLRKLESGLRGISHVIVDEIHERDLNSDFLLVVLSDVMRTFPDARIVLMSATIDTTMFSEYFGCCPVIEVHGRTFTVQEYLLEDCIQMTNFVAPPPDKRKKGQDDDGGGTDEEVNCNQICAAGYSEATKRAMAQLSEKELSFELVEALIRYIGTLSVHGAILVFLPGWNLIFALQKYLENLPHFASTFALQRCAAGYEVMGSPTDEAGPLPPPEEEEEDDMFDAHGRQHEHEQHHGEEAAQRQECGMGTPAGRGRAEPVTCSSGGGGI